jgi:hypothetical protein
VLKRINRTRVRAGLSLLMVEDKRDVQLDRGKLLAVVKDERERRGEQALRAIDVKLAWLRKYPDKSFGLECFKRALAELRTAGHSEAASRGARKAPDELLIESASKARDYLGRNPMLAHVYETMRILSPNTKLGKDGVKAALRRIAGTSPEAALEVETSRNGVPTAIVTRELFERTVVNPFIGDFLTYLKPYDLNSLDRGLAPRKGLVLRQPDYDMQRTPLGAALTAADGTSNAHAIEHARAMIDLNRASGTNPVLRTLVLSKNESGEFVFSRDELTSLIFFIAARGLTFLNLKPGLQHEVHEVCGALLGHNAKMRERANPRFYLEPLLQNSRVEPKREEGFSRRYSMLGILEEIVALTLHTRWGLPSESVVPKIEADEPASSEVQVEPGPTDAELALEEESFPDLRGEL